MALAVSCEKDGERLVASNPTEPTDFSASATEIRLSEATASDLALTLFWNLGEIPQLSDPDIAYTDALVSYALQMSRTDDFGTVSETALEKDQTSIQFTGLELNRQMLKLGISDETMHDIYCRISINMGKNKIYSSVLNLGIAAYIDDSAGTMKIVDKDTKSIVVGVLRCKEATPTLFEGFVNTPGGWYNCYFIAADGTVWGSGIGDNQWLTFGMIPNSTNHTWFGEPAGCNYVFAETGTNAQWWHIYTPEVTATVEGADVTLTYSAAEDGFVGTITTASDNAAVTFSGTGQRWDVTTGTDAGAGIDSQFCLAPASDGTFSFVEDSSTEGSITVEAAGTYTLKMNTSAMTWTLTEGAYEGGEEEDEEPEWPADPDYVAATGDYLYIYSSSGDKVPQSTDGKLKKGTDGIYAGYFHMAAWYNFQFGDSEDYSSATILYGSAPVSDTGLYRLYCGSDKWNIWEPEGVDKYTYITVDTEARSWAFTTVESIEIVGNFNDWGKAFKSPLVYDPATKTWSCEIEAADWGEWGLHYIVNGNWDWGFQDADNDGVLENVSKDAMPSVPAGKYLVTLDLNDPDKRTVKFTAL